MKKYQVVVEFKDKYTGGKFIEQAYHADSVEEAIKMGNLDEPGVEYRIKDVIDLEKAMEEMGIEL